MGAGAPDNQSTVLFVATQPMLPPELSFRDSSITVNGRSWPVAFQAGDAGIV
jgi:hypothetical protein